MRVPVPVPALAAPRSGRPRARSPSRVSVVDEQRLAALVRLSERSCRAEVQNSTLATPVSAPVEMSALCVLESAHLARRRAEREVVHARGAPPPAHHRPYPAASLLPISSTHPAFASGSFRLPHR